MVLLLLLHIYAAQRLVPGVKFGVLLFQSRHLQGCRMNVRGCNDILDSLYFTILHDAAESVLQCVSSPFTSLVFLA